MTNIAKICRHLQNLQRKAAEIYEEIWAQIFLKDEIAMDLLMLFTIWRFVDDIYLLPTPRYPT